MFLVLSLPQNKTKTYPLARKYKYPNYLMKNYYSVHPVPSEKYREKIWVRHRNFFVLQRGIEFVAHVFVPDTHEIPSSLSYSYLPHHCHFSLCLLCASLSTILKARNLTSLKYSDQRIFYAREPQEV